MFDEEKPPQINVFARTIKDVISVFEFYLFLQRNLSGEYNTMDRALIGYGDN